MPTGVPGRRETGLKLVTGRFRPAPTSGPCYTEPTPPSPRRPPLLDARRRRGEQFKLHEANLAGRRKVPEQERTEQHPGVMQCRRSSSLETGCSLRAARPRHGIWSAVGRGSWVMGHGLLASSHRHRRGHTRPRPVSTLLPARLQVLGFRCSQHSLADALYRQSEAGRASAAGCLTPTHEYLAHSASVPVAASGALPGVVRCARGRVSAQLWLFVGPARGPALQRSLIAPSSARPGMRCERSWERVLRVSRVWRVARRAGGRALEQGQPAPVRALAARMLRVRTQREREARAAQPSTQWVGVVHPPSCLTWPCSPISGNAAHARGRAANIHR